MGIMQYNSDSYLKIITTALDKGYKFCTFAELPNKPKQIFLRHDIDYSVSLALEMARLDASCNIRATFAVQVTSPFYNPFNPTSIRDINAIKALGHDIALHCKLLPGCDGAEKDYYVNREMTILRSYFPFVSPVLSWHNPPSDKRKTQAAVTGFINAYSPEFTRDIYYISDSVTRHDPIDFINILNTGQSIQMLLHPLIWLSGTQDMASMINRVLIETVRNCENECAENRLWRERYPVGIPLRVSDGQGKPINPLDDIRPLCF